MKASFLVAVACLLLTGPALAMTDAECTTMWTQADTNGDGVLNDAEAGRYMAMMRIANKAMSADGVITQAIFEENCKANIFKVAAVEAGAPLEGANSFTETQAKDRVVANGMATPTTMIKDSKVTWRGAATQKGMGVDVALDYKGNVAAK